MRGRSPVSVLNGAVGAGAGGPPECFHGLVEEVVHLTLVVPAVAVVRGWKYDRENLLGGERVLIGVAQGGFDPIEEVVHLGLVVPALADRGFGERDVHDVIRTERHLDLLGASG